jgi:hypothetical protein
MRGRGMEGGGGEWEILIKICLIQKSGRGEILIKYMFSSRGEGRGGEGEGEGGILRLI